MSVNEFISKLNLALNSKTIYVLGCFGAPLNTTNKKRYTSNNSYNKGRAAMINACSADTFGFDCVCLIKGILWGWNADPSKTYGGAVYCSNGVPDIGAQEMGNRVLNKSSDMSDIDVGEYLYMQGHCGIYVGDGYVIECSPKWENKVQKTAIWDRPWEFHGYLPYVDYTDESGSDKYEKALRDIKSIIDEVIK